MYARHNPNVCFIWPTLAIGVDVDGRKFIGIERERRYFDLSCERISRAQAQGTLLPPEEPRQPVQEGLL